MALSQKADAVMTVKRGPTCTVCVALQLLPKDDAAVLTGWLTDPNVPYTKISEQTEDDDDTPTLGASELSRHARGRCSAGVRLRQ